MAFQIWFPGSYRSDTRIRYDLPNFGKYDFDLTKDKILEGFFIFRKLHKMSLSASTAKSSFCTDWKGIESGEQLIALFF
jgi:hypothetical protein